MKHENLGLKILFAAILISSTLSCRSFHARGTSDQAEVKIFGGTPVTEALPNVPLFKMMNKVQYAECQQSLKAQNQILNDEGHTKFLSDREIDEKIFLEGACSDVNINTCTGVFTNYHPLNADDNAILFLVTAAHCVINDPANTEMRVFSEIPTNSDRTVLEHLVVSTAPKALHGVVLVSRDFFMLPVDPTLFFTHPKLDPGIFNNISEPQAALKLSVYDIAVFPFQLGTDENPQLKLHDTVFLDAAQLAELKRQVSPVDFNPLNQANLASQDRLVSGTIFGWGDIGLKEVEGEGMFATKSNNHNVLYSKSDVLIGPIKMYPSGEEAIASVSSGLLLATNALLNHDSGTPLLSKNSLLGIGITCHILPKKNPDSGELVLNPKSSPICAYLPDSPSVDLSIEEIKNIFVDLHHPRSISLFEMSFQYERGSAVFSGPINHWCLQTGDATNIALCRRAKGLFLVKNIESELRINTAFQEYYSNESFQNNIENILQYNDVEIVISEDDFIGKCPAKKQCLYTEPSPSQASIPLGNRITHPIPEGIIYTNTDNNCHSVLVSYNGKTYRISPKHCGGNCLTITSQDFDACLEEISTSSSSTNRGVGIALVNQATCQESGCAFVYRDEIRQHNVDSDLPIPSSSELESSDFTCLSPNDLDLAKPTKPLCNLPVDTAQGSSGAPLFLFENNRLGLYCMQIQTDKGLNKCQKVAPIFAPLDLQRTSP